MRSPIQLNHKERKIIMDRSFSKLASNPYSEEYEKLQEIRHDYPKYKVITRQIKKNSNKQTYAGLTYEAMEYYIRNYEQPDNVEEAFDEYIEQRVIANLFSKGKSYPLVKSWFLTKYPNVAKGMTRADYQKELEKTEQQETTNTQSESVMTPILNPVAA